MLDTLAAHVVQRDRLRGFGRQPGVQLRDLLLRDLQRGRALWRIRAIEERQHVLLVAVFVEAGLEIQEAQEAVIVRVDGRDDSVDLFDR